MTNKKKALIWLIILAVSLAFIIWHTVRWHKMGVHAKIFESIRAGKSYIAVIYNLGLMAALGILLGLFMEKVTQVIGYEVKEIKHFEDEEPAGARTGTAREGKAR